MKGFFKWIRFWN